MYRYQSCISMLAPRLILLPFFALAFSALQCKKEQVTAAGSNKPVVLPGYTEYGANSFAWILDNKELVIANDYWPVDARISGFYVPNSGQFEVSGHRYDGKASSSVRIYLKKVFAPGKYIVDESNNYINYYVDGVDGTPDQNFYTDSLHTGEVVITKVDTVNFIIAGRFSSKLRRYSSNNPLTDTMSIDGQFDFSYPPKN